MLALRTFQRTLTTTPRVLSGHNKWSTIKHDKAKNDAEKNRLANKFAAQIAIAAKLGGSADPALNIRLATAIENASKQNVPKKVIENAIKRGAGISDGSEKPSEPVVYEGLGPGGVAFIVEALTDNKNRTVGLVKSSFTKSGGSLSSVGYMFDRKGYVVVAPPAELNDFDSIFEKVCELEGVEDLLEDGPVFEVVTDVASSGSVATELKGDGFEIKEVGSAYFPKEDMMVDLDEESMVKYEKLIKMLEEVDEITDFYTNLRE